MSDSILVLVYVVWGNSCAFNPRYSCKQVHILIYRQCYGSCPSCDNPSTACAPVTSDALAVQDNDDRRLPHIQNRRGCALSVFGLLLYFRYTSR